MIRIGAIGSKFSTPEAGANPIRCTIEPTEVGGVLVTCPATVDTHCAPGASPDRNEL
jgi:hypothetical protein